jgi:hypothetical protein
VLQRLQNHLHKLELRGVLAKRCEVPRAKKPDN